MKFSTVTRLAFIALCAVTLTHCKNIQSKTGIGNQTKLYQKAVQPAPLEVPGDLKNSKIGSETETLPNEVTPKVLATVPLPPGSLAQQINSGEVSKTILNTKLPEPK